MGVEQEAGVPTSSAPLSLLVVMCCSQTLSVHAARHEDHDVHWCTGVLARVSPTFMVIVMRIMTWIVMPCGWCMPCEHDTESVRSLKGDLDVQSV